MTDDKMTMADHRQPRRRRVHVTAWSPAPPEQVFALLSDVETWTDWAGFKQASYEAEGQPSRHGVGAVRRFRAGPLSSRETVLEFEPPRRLVYDYVGTMPFDDYRGEVTLARHRQGTRITWHADFRPKRPLTGTPLRHIMTRVLHTVAVRLANAAATMNPDTPDDVPNATAGAR